MESTAAIVASALFFLAGLGVGLLLLRQARAGSALAARQAE